MKNLGKPIILSIIGVLIIAIMILTAMDQGDINIEKKIEETEKQTTNNERYNYQFIESDVQTKLTKKIGTTGKIAFHNPPNNIHNIKAGTLYGIAFALQNANPNTTGENYFEYQITPTNTKECETNTKEATNWITMGQSSFGKIPQGWIDHATIVFEIPKEQKPCTAEFEFHITRDKETYTKETITLNIE